MKRIAVDYNTVMQDVEHDNRVILGQVGHPTGDRLPPLTEGEHVVTYDEEMEVEGIVEREGKFWLAALDWNTIKRCEAVL